jgi:hypothetical protein
MPYADRDVQRAYQREWDRTHRPSHYEAFVNAQQRKIDLEAILRRKLTWREFSEYDSGEAVAPDIES